jgi:hypothetical protein
MIQCSDVVEYQRFGKHSPYINFTLKMEEEQPSKMLVSYHITAWCHNPEHHDMRSFIAMKTSKLARYKQDSGYSDSIQESISLD